MAQQQYYPQNPQGDFLMPLHTALGVSHEYIARQPEILMLREGWSWTGDQFRIHTVDGREILQMNARVLSMSDRKEFLTSQGQLLYTLRRRLFSIPKSFYLEDASGSEFLHINGGWSFGTKLEVSFLNMLDPSGPKPVTLQVRGDWIERRAEIMWNGVPVARVRRQFANWRELSSRHTYGVEVAPGADLALIAALVVAIDEDRRNNN